LTKHFRDEIKSASLGDLFREEQQRFTQFSLEACDLFLDYSKNFLMRETVNSLTSLAGEAGVPAAIEAMFAGEEINITENRPVLHVALRSKLSDQVALDTSGVADIWKTLEQMSQFVGAVNDGTVRGNTGRRLTEIVNIGIGGSDLGTTMACSSTACRTSTAHNLLT
jgi:glucose-6-phosphate isomerase